MIENEDREGRGWGVGGGVKRRGGMGRRGGEERRVGKEGGEGVGRKGGR